MDEIRARHMQKLAREWRADRIGRRGYGSIELHRPRPGEQVGDTFVVDQRPLGKVEHRQVVDQLAQSVAAQARQNPQYVEYLVDRLMEAGALGGMTRDQALSAVGDVIQKYAEMNVHQTANRLGRDW